MTLFLVSLNAKLGFKVSFMYSGLTVFAAKAERTRQCKVSSCQCQVSRQVEIGFGFIFRERRQSPAIITLVD